MNLKPKFNLVALVCFVSLLGAPPAANSQTASEFIDFLISKYFGEQAKNLMKRVDNLRSQRSKFNSQSWEFSDVSSSRMRVTTFQNEVCAERINTKEKMCIDSSKGPNKQQFASGLMPDGTGEKFTLYVDGSRILVESERVACTSGSMTVWITTYNGNEPTKKSETYSSGIFLTGGLNGCS
jgi:hypothetical protein